MFKNLINFSYQRNTKEAIGFYMAYLALMVATAIILGSMGSLVTQNNTFNFGLRIGNIVAIIVSLGLSFIILKDKKLLGNFGFILLILLSGLLAIFFGGLGGLVPAAYLTTKPTNAK